MKTFLKCCLPVVNKALGCTCFLVFIIGAHAFNVMSTTRHWIHRWSAVEKKENVTNNSKGGFVSLSATLVVGPTTQKSLRLRRRWDWDPSEWASECGVVTQERRRKANCTFSAPTVRESRFSGSDALSLSPLCPHLYSYPYPSSAKVEMPTDNSSC